MIAAQLRHGGASKTNGVSPEYRAWADMRQRCKNPRNRNFPNYGGRGIGVDPRWDCSFEAFLADVGHRPSADHTIDRVDVDGDYAPGNVRWATDEQQRRNTRRSVLLTFQGRTQCVEDWADELGIHKSTIGGRLRSGWSTDRALATPPDAVRSANGRKGAVCRYGS